MILNIDMFNLNVTHNNDKYDIFVCLLTIW